MGDRVIMAAPGDSVELTDEELKPYQEMVDNGLLLSTKGSDK